MPIGTKPRKGLVGFRSPTLPNVLTVGDYEPFGAPLRNRVFEDVPPCSTYVTNDSVFVANENFSTLSTTDLTLANGFLFGATVTDYGVASGRMFVTSATKYAACLKYFNTVPGQTYTLRVYIGNGTATSTDIGARYLNGGAAAVLASTFIYSSGYYTLTFTVPAGVTQMWLQCQNRTNTGTTATFYVDNIKVWNMQNVTHTDCSVVGDNDYRFGFNGVEKNNELYGEGNAYDFDYRIHDARIGRFLSIDPLTNKFPFYSPYQFAGNKPIQNVDFEGAEDVPNEIVNSAKTFGRAYINKLTNYLLMRTANVVTKVAEVHAEKKLENLANSSNKNMQMFAIFTEFVTGLGPEHRHFGPEASITKSLKQSYLTEAAVLVWADAY